MSFARHVLCIAFMVCSASFVVSASSALPTVSSNSFVHTDLSRAIDLRTHIEEVTLQIKAKNTGVS
jgi:hypothetical protein